MPEHYRSTTASLQDTDPASILHSTREVLIRITEYYKNTVYTVNTTQNTTDTANLEKLQIQ